MKKHFRFFLLLVGISIALVACQNEEPEKAKKAVFIIVDGIAEDMLASAETPQFDKIASEGRLLKAHVGGHKGTYSETPTISAVGYNSLLTGTWYNKHEVFDNYNQSPNYHYPTLFKLFNETFPNKKTAIFSSWKDNRTVLIGEDLPETNHLKLDYVFDGFELDTLTYPHDPDSDYIRKIDSTVVEKAIATIRSEAPDYSWVYLQYTDDVAHRNGDGKALNKAITFEDELVGKIYEAVKTREKDHAEDWLFVVTTDHGRDAKGYGHGGQSDRERNTWIYLNKPTVNEYAKNNRVPIVDLFPTLANHLEINLSKETKQEVDGVDLLKDIKAFGLKGELQKDELQLTWNSLISDDSKGELFVSKTNNYKKGSKDDYRSLGEVNLKEETFTTSIDSSEFYKVLLKYDDQILNTWIKN